jgi:hypothetical protein
MARTFPARRPWPCDPTNGALVRGIWSSHVGTGGRALHADRGALCAGGRVEHRPGNRERRVRESQRVRRPAIQGGDRNREPVDPDGPCGPSRLPGSAAGWAPRWHRRRDAGRRSERQHVSACTSPGSARPLGGERHRVLGVGFFPSGHATGAMSVACALVAFVPARRAPLAALAGGAYPATVGVALVAPANHHRSSDVLAGLLVAAAWMELIQAARPHGRSPPRPARSACRSSPRSSRRSAAHSRPWCRAYALTSTRNSCSRLRS